MRDVLQCLILEDDTVSRQLLEKFIEKTEGLELVNSCNSAEEALNKLQLQPVDLIFLDIELPEASGIDFLNSLDKKPMVIFVTGESDYALEAFDHRAVDFLLKPFNYPRFTQAIQRAKELYHLNENGHAEAGTLESVDLDAIFVRHNSKYIKVPIKEILWVEAIGDYVQINCLPNATSKQRRYTVHSTMKGMEQKLPAQQFKRVHRSYIVRLDVIQEIEDSTLVLEGDKMVPVGKSYKNNLMQSLNLI
jgi:DNA-binding LytR/AlgR family response regulator